jgi:hypothetical protein
VKAVLVGNLANVLMFLAMTLIVVFVALVAILVSQGVEGLRHAQLAGVSLYIVVMFPAIAAVTSGYIAALYAKKSPLLNGALSTAATIALSLYSDAVGFFPPSDEPAALPPVVDWVLSYSAPLFGLLGAYLRPFAEPRTILRWVAAISAMIGTYVLVLLLGLALSLWWKTLTTLYLFVVFAARFGIIAGTYAAPKHLREQAMWVLIGVTLSVTTIAFIGLALSLHSSAWLFLVPLNAVGCYLTYRTMARTLTQVGQAPSAV